MLCVWVIAPHACLVPTEAKKRVLDSLEQQLTDSCDHHVAGSVTRT